MNPLKPNTVDPWKITTIILITVIVLAAGTVAYFRYFRDGGLTNTNDNGSVKLTGNLVTNKLDGTKVDSALANRHPLAIMVENHPDARPQVGLDKASIIYEAITEGGITRFMAIFGPQDAKKVGPVRSVRTYFVDWAKEFNAFLAHVGGNLDALDKIKADSVLDLDEFALGQTAYWREPAAGIATEHTMFTDTSKLYAAAKAKGWTMTGIYDGLTFRTPDMSKAGTSERISIDFSEPQYRVVWDYDKDANKYLRTLGGYAHRDRSSGERLSAANIIIQEVTRWDAPTTINEQGWAMQTVGTGNAKMFIEGKEVSGTWKKTSSTSRTNFYDAGGAEIKFIPGQTWIEIAPPEVFSKIAIE